MEGHGGDPGGHGLKLHDAEGFVAAVRRQHQHLGGGEAAQLARLIQPPPELHGQPLGQLLELVPAGAIPHHIEPPWGLQGDQGAQQQVDPLVAIEATDEQHPQGISRGCWSVRPWRQGQRSRLQAGIKTTRQGPQPGPPATAAHQLRHQDRRGGDHKGYLFHHQEGQLLVKTHQQARGRDLSLEKSVPVHAEGTAGLHDSGQQQQQQHPRTGQMGMKGLAGAEQSPEGSARQRQQQPTQRQAG